MAKLDDEDLETIVGAIVALSTKVEGSNKRPVTIDHKALAELIVTMNADTRTTAAKKLDDSAQRLGAATAALEHEGSKSEARLLQQRTALMRDTDVERDKRRRWQWIAGGATLLLLVTLLAGPWIAHSYFVRTVSGCYALGGKFLAGKVGSGYPDVCWFDIGEPR